MLEGRGKIPFAGGGKQMTRYVTKVIKSSGRWLNLGGRRFYARSKWEANYARYLEFQKQNEIIKEWYYEPETFWFGDIKRGVRSYLPDFKVCPSPGVHYWVEVKGYLDAKSATKLKRMAKYYPNEMVVVVDGKWFANNNSKLKGLIKGWE